MPELPKGPVSSLLESIGGALCPAGWCRAISFCDSAANSYRFQTPALRQSEGEGHGGRTTRVFPGDLPVLAGGTEPNEPSAAVETFDPSQPGPWWDPHAKVWPVGWKSDPFCRDRPPDVQIGTSSQKWPHVVIEGGAQWARAIASFLAPAIGT